MQAGLVFFLTIDSFIEVLGQSELGKALQASAVPAVTQVVIASFPWAASTALVLPALRRTGTRQGSSLARCNVLLDMILGSSLGCALLRAVQGGREWLTSESRAVLIACQMGAMFCIPQRTCAKYRVTSLEWKDQLLRHWPCSNCRTSVRIRKKNSNGCRVVWETNSG